MSTPIAPHGLTCVQIRESKGKRRIAMLTAYDYPSAIYADAAGVDILLVGDSLGMTVLGDTDTLRVTMQAMLHHCQAVCRAKPRALVVCDMPFLSYEEGVSSALRNAGKLMAEGGARGVKLEGGTAILPQVKALVTAGIPVMGHLGLTPQRVASLGGYKVQGRTAKAAQALVEEAKLLEEAGCFALVLECIPHEVAALITKTIHIPTIGIGAGAACDGQVLVFHDMLGINPGRTPRFVKTYAHIGEQMTKAIKAYVDDVQKGAFPTQEHQFSLEADEAKALMLNVSQEQK